MKVLLIATNQADRFMDRMVVRPVPIGLAYLAASVDEERHTLRVLDLMFADDAVAEVAEVVSEFQPDLIGLSIRNLDNQSNLNPVWNLPAVRDIIERIRQLSGAKTLIGGPAFSIMPSECLDYVGADLGIAGDAAEAFATLVERIDEGADYRDVPGIVYRDDANGGGIVVSEGRFASNFHRAPRLDLLDMRAYNGSGFGVGVITKLAQSYYPTPGADYSGADWRIRDPQEVVDEIRALGDDFGINKVFFIDSGFNIPAEHAKATCRADHRRRAACALEQLRAPVRGCGCRAYGSDEEIGLLACADGGEWTWRRRTWRQAGGVGTHGGAEPGGGLAVHDECSLWRTWGE